MSDPTRREAILAAAKLGLVTLLTPAGLMAQGATEQTAGRITLKVNVQDERLYFFDPRDRKAYELWPVNPRAQMVVLAPGEAGLVQIGGEGQGRNF